MASLLGRNAFTVQESVNMDAFTDWYYEELDLNDSSTTFSYGSVNMTAGANTLSNFTASGSKVIEVGMHVTGTNIPANTYLTSVTLSSETNKYSLVMSANAAGSGAQTPTVTFNGGTDTETATYITSANPAKKVLIYEVPGSSSSYLQATDILSILINGTKTIKIDAADLPFTLPRGLITSLSVSIDQANITDEISVLSFH